MTAHPAADRLVDLAAEARGRPRSARGFVAVAGGAVRTVHRAAGRRWHVSVAIQLVQAGLVVGQVLATQRALAAVVASSDDGRPIGAVALPALVLAGCGLVSGVLLVWDQQLQRQVGVLVERATWDRLLDVTTSVDLVTFESPAFFDRLRRLEANALLRPFSTATALVNLVGGVVGGAAVTVVLVRLEPLLVPVLVVGGVPVLLLARTAARLEFDLAVRTTPDTRVRRYLREVLIGRTEAKELRSFAATDPLRARYDDLYDRYVDALDAHARRRVRLGLAGASATSAATGVCLGVILLLVANRGTGLPEAGAALLAVRLLGTRVQQLAGGAGGLSESALFLEELEDFGAMAPTPVVEGRPAPPRLAHLALRDVSFRYPGATTDAIVDVDLDLRPGEVVALVGENGSGKTTVAKLVAQLYEPTAGAVVWNGTPADAFDAAGRRRQVSVLFQDFVRFGLPADLNVGLGDGDLSPDELRVRAAAARAGLDDVVERLPDGWSTVLGKEFAGGVDLSGGEWQRVALARASYRDASIVVLDEPTASLDPRAEHDLYARVRELYAGRAVLLVTHRLASVRHADRILVLERGRVVEVGDHESLVAVGGRYAELYELQASAFGPEPRDDVAAPADIR